MYAAHGKDQPQGVLILETVIKVLIALVGLVLAGIIGNFAFAWFKRLWHLRRKDVDDLEVAELQAALRAVLDIYKQGRRAKTFRPSNDEKRALKKKTKEFKNTRNALRWEDTGFAEQKLTEWATKAPGAGDTPGGQFGPLVAYACSGVSPSVKESLLKDFEPGLRLHFHRRLRDSVPLSQLLAAEFFTGSQDITERWRNPDRQREPELDEQPIRMEEDVSLLFKQYVGLQRKMHDLPEEIGAVVNECLEEVERHPEHLPVIIKQLPTMLRRRYDRRDVLVGYPELQTRWVGRLEELGNMATAWRSGTTRVYGVVGFGGQGKTALVRRFTETLRRLERPDARPLVIWWSFYLNRSADEFFDQAAEPLHIPLHNEETYTRRNSEQIAGDIIDRMRTGVDGRRVLLVLDGLEVLQETAIGREGRLKDAALYGLLKGVLDDAEPDTDASGMILITTREPLTDLKPDEFRPFTIITLGELSATDGADLLLKHYGLNINREEAEEFTTEVGGHALTLTLTETLLREPGATSATVQELREFIASEDTKVTDRDVTTRTHRLPGYVLRHCGEALNAEHRQVMRLLSCCVRPATRRDFEEVFLQPIGETDEEKRVNDKLVGRTYIDVRNGLIRHLCELHLIEGDEDAGYDMHPLIRSHFYQEETGEAVLTRAQRKAVHARFFEVLPKRQPKHHPDTMPEMEPLIDAVLHGCRAGRANEAFFSLFYARIDRRDTGQVTSYLSAHLGVPETHLQLLRAFFPDGDLTADPQVSTEAVKGVLVIAAALALMSTGRPGDAIPLCGRGAEMRFIQSNWVNRSAAFQNLSESHATLGRLPAAFEAAGNALAELEKVPASEVRKTPYTIFSHGCAARAAAQRGDDRTAANHFQKAIELHTVDWLWGIPGASHCTWLARSGSFERPRSAGEKNAEACVRQGDLPSQTFVFATQALVERLAWAASDSERKTLDEMQAFAEEAVKVGKRSGDHYYYTYALLEAGRCAAARAVHEPDRRQEHAARAERHLAEAESRADYAGYRTIHADIHVTRAQLARVAGNTQIMRKQCEAAIAICDDPTCDYAWAKEDALALLADPNSET